MQNPSLHCDYGLQNFSVLHHYPSVCPIFHTHKIDVTTKSFITKSNKTGQLVTKRTPYEDYDCNNKNTFIISSTISKAQYNLNILTTWITILQTSLLNNPTKTSTCQFENFHKILPISHYKWKL